MSNIYIQEPSTNGKVLLVTSVGDIDIELWSKEAPRACRNFVQLCMEGYYDGTIFHRVVKEFIVQGGDPTGTGDGGESIYGQPFKDELHSRLRFVRRGLVAMANGGPHDNGSQFFFTMAMTPELLGKHTIFGKVGGETIYNMLRLQEVETDGQERPLYPSKIIRTEILSNPYDDIIPRILKKSKKDKEEDRKTKSKSKATKNFSLLSFGTEAEEDEEQVFKVSKNFSGKSKSSHDLTDDPRLSSVPLPVMDKSEDGRGSGKRLAQDDEQSEREKKEGVDAVKKKLKKDEADPKMDMPQTEKDISKEDKKKSKSDELRKESRRLQREIKASKKRSEALKQGHTEELKDGGEGGDDKPIKTDENGEPADFLESFKQERQKYKLLKREQKGKNREEETLALLKKFQSKLTSVKQTAADVEEEEQSKVEEKEEAEDLVDDEPGDGSWMRHKLKFDESRQAKVLDANIDDNERFEIHDPRNPMNKRRREDGKKKSKRKER